MRKNISVMGLMSAYNDKVATILADRLDAAYLEGLEYIAYELTYPIDTFIKDFGKELYDKKEDKAIQALKDYENIIIDVPLRIMEKEHLIEHLKMHSWIVLLTASQHSLNQRGGGDYKRQRQFEKFADIVIDATGLTPINCAKEITKQFVKIMEE